MRLGNHNFIDCFLKRINKKEAVLKYSLFGFRYKKRVGLNKCEMVPTLGDVD